MVYRRDSTWGHIIRLLFSHIPRAAQAVAELHLVRLLQQFEYAQVLIMSIVEDTSVFFNEYFSRPVHAHATEKRYSALSPLYLVFDDVPLTPLLTGRDLGLLMLLLRVQDNGDSDSENVDSFERTCLTRAVVMATLVLARLKHLGIYISDSPQGQEDSVELEEADGGALGWIVAVQEVVSDLLQLDADPHRPPDEEGLVLFADILLLALRQDVVIDACVTLAVFELEFARKAPPCSILPIGDSAIDRSPFTPSRRALSDLHMGTLTLAEIAFHVIPLLFVGDGVCPSKIASLLLANLSRHNAAYTDAVEQLAKLGADKGEEWLASDERDSTACEQLQESIRQRGAKVKALGSLIRHLLEHNFAQFAALEGLVQAELSNLCDLSLNLVGVGLLQALGSVAGVFGWTDTFTLLVDLIQMRYVRSLDHAETRAAVQLLCGLYSRVPPWAQVEVANAISPAFSLDISVRRPLYWQLLHALLEDESEVCREAMSVLADHVNEALSNYFDLRSLSSSACRGVSYAYCLNDFTCVLLTIFVCLQALVDADKFTEVDRSSGRRSFCDDFPALLALVFVIQRRLAPSLAAQTLHALAVQVLSMKSFTGKRQQEHTQLASSGNIQAAKKRLLLTVGRGECKQ